MNKPNILLITSDQHRADCLGFAGHPCIRTPHLDQLAFEGIHFVNAYADCPICIPSRTSIITGREAWRNGCTAYNHEYRVKRKRSDFLGSVITAGGYQTQLIGKTHWHTDASFRAGFEGVTGLDRLSELRLLRLGDWASMPEGIGGNEFNPVLSHIPHELSSSNWIVEEGLKFLSYREKEQPFFLWMSFIDPHPPMAIHEPYYSMYDNEQIPEPIYPEWASDDEAPYELFCNRLVFNPKPMSAAENRKVRSVYYGMISNMDFQLGRLFGRLMQENLWDDTLKIYTTDHGEKLGDFADFSKSAFYENTAQVPFIAKCPSSIDSEPGIKSTALVQLTDLLPTLCDIAGIKMPGDVTGKSLFGILSGGDNAVRNEIHGHINHSHMYHDGKFKYLYFAHDGSELVFDVETDRKDEHDLSSDTKLLDKMRKGFINCLKREKHELLQDGKLQNLHLKKPPKNQLRASSNACAWHCNQWASRSEIHQWYG